MAKVIKIKQSDIDKLPAEIRGNPVLMDIVKTIVTSYTKLEELLGYDLVLVSDSTPVIVPDEAPASGILNDTNIRISIRHNGQEVENDGSVTYLKGVITTKPTPDGFRPCGVQWNNKTAAPGEGERNCWIDRENVGTRVGEIPADKADVIVCWYEK